MGGGLALFKSNNQFYKASQELNEVKYIFRPFGNATLFDLTRFEKILNKDVSKYFKRNAIKHRRIDVGWGGGG